VKKRIGFVSNSSSSSFVIPLSEISGEQLQKILNPEYNTQGYGDKSSFPYTWYTSVDEDSNIVTGNTSMDNFDMHKYFETIGINMDTVTWDY